MRQKLTNDDSSRRASLGNADASAHANHDSGGCFNGNARGYKSGNGGNNIPFGQGSSNPLAGRGGYMRKGWYHPPRWDPAPGTKRLHQGPLLAPASPPAENVWETRRMEMREREEMLKYFLPKEVSERLLLLTEEHYYRRPSPPLSRCSCGGGACKGRHHYHRAATSNGGWDTVGTENGDARADNDTGSSTSIGNDTETDDAASSSSSCNGASETNGEDYDTAKEGDTNGADKTSEDDYDTAVTGGGSANGTASSGGVNGDNSGLHPSVGATSTRSWSPFDSPFL